MPLNLSTFIEMLFKVWLMDSVHLNSLGYLWKKKFLPGFSLCCPESEYLGIFFFLLCILKRLSKQKAYLFWAKENLPLIILTLGLAHTFSSAWFSEYCLSVLGSICYSVFFRDLLERTLIDKDLYFFFLPAHSFCCLERLRSNTSQSFHTFFILFL